MTKKDDKTPVNMPNKRAVTIGAIVLIVLLLILFAAQLGAPKHSVAAYCQTYKDEKARLAALPGDTWPSGVFNEAASDAGEFATAFGKLEKVAPDEIRPDVATLQSVYQKIHDDPSQAIGASLSGTKADSSVEHWTDKHCL